MAKNVNQVYTANPLTSLTGTSLVYIGADGVDGAIQVQNLFNTTNLQLTTGKLNTIQNIALASSPSFRGLSLTGSSTGTISIITQAAAGTYNWNMPNGPGFPGQFLTSGGGDSSVMTWSHPTVPSTTYTITKVNDVDYTVLVTDSYIGYTALTANRTATLPSAALVAGQLFIIKNETTATFPVELIVTASSGLINGAASRNLSLSHSGAQFLSDGANYWIVAVTSQFVG